MKKVMVIGCCGSGKSTFSKKLHEKTGLPVYHLDMMNWNSDRTTVPKSVFIDRLNSIIAKESWIIDGNYGSTMEMRMKACDTIFFLDYPLEVCLNGVKNRLGKPRSDMPWIEENEDQEFIEFIRNFRTVNRPAILELLNKYPKVNVHIFASRLDAENYLTQSTREIS